MTSPTTEKTTHRLTDNARNAGRSTVSLLRDGGYATIGATDAAVTAVRRLGERAQQLQIDLPKLRNRDELYASLRELGAGVEERFDALAGRGREVVESLQRSRAARNVGSKISVVDSQINAAVADARRAGEAAGEAVAAAGDEKATDYGSLTVGQLRELARERDIPGRHDMTKAQLVAALRKA